MSSRSRRRPRALAPLWFKDAVIYELHVKTFADSDGDGVGDFPGLTAKLDYLQRLGVTCLWLLPFYESPLRDDGYDVAHYERVDPRYGTIEDFQTFVDTAHARGLHVVTELVINHTSDQHPWFQAARRAPPGSPKRDYYVWSDTTERYRDARIIFGDVEASNWTWDPVASAFFWHRFFHHQPDLNLANPRVRTAVLKVMRFWLDRGVDGLRLDAVAHLFERDGTSCDNLPETHQFLKDIRADIDSRYPNRVFIAEVNQLPELTMPYFGDGEGDECHMTFHFPLMPRLFMALAREEASPIVDVVERTKHLPQTCQWAIFLRNHDELTLSALSDEDRAFLLDIYAQDKRAYLNHGIRRRLAPLLGHDAARLRLAHALLLSLPGTPVMYYGDEIGMGDDLRLSDRDGVRTPMQWTTGLNGGFSAAATDALALPVIDGDYGCQALNVEQQEGDAASLLRAVAHMLHVRAAHRAFGRGGIEFLECRNRHVLTFTRCHEGETILVAINLARTPQDAAIELPPAFQGAELVDLLDERTGRGATATGAPYALALPADGFCWLYVRASKAQGPTLKAQ